MIILILSLCNDHITLLEEIDHINLLVGHHTIRVLFSLDWSLSCSNSSNHFPKLVNSSSQNHVFSTIDHFHQSQRDSSHSWKKFYEIVEWSVRSIGGHPASEDILLITEVHHFTNQWIYFWKLYLFIPVTAPLVRALKRDAESAVHGVLHVHDFSSAK